MGLLKHSLKNIYYILPNLLVPHMMRIKCTLFNSIRKTLINKYIYVSSYVRKKQDKDYKMVNF